MSNHFESGTSPVGASLSSPLIPLTDVPKLHWLPNLGGRRLAVQTVYRWTKRGVRGHRLRALRIGRQTCTTEAWLFDFFEKITDGPAAGASATRTPAQRLRDQDAARRVLDEAGI